MKKQTFIVACCCITVVFLLHGKLFAMPAPCGNESCSVAETIIVDGTCLSGNLGCDNIGDPAQSCGPPNVGSAWYNFLAPTSGNVDITMSISAGSYTPIVVYSGLCGTQTEVSCTYDGVSNPLTATVTGLIPSSIYYIMLPAPDQTTSISPLCVTESTNMNYFSSTATQNNITNVNTGANKEIIGIEIVTTGTLNPLDANSFYFNTNGTTNPSTDIANAKLWTTGTSSVFAATTQLGATIAAPNGAFTISGFTQILSGGTNYFWLTYDVPAGATDGNFVDAECDSVIVNGITRTPTITAPTGNREIFYNVWTGAISTDWHTTGNWSKGVIPTSTTPVEIPAGTPNEPLISAGSAQCKDLIIKSGAMLTVSVIGAGMYFDVYGNLTNDGIINRTENEIRIMGDNMKHLLGGTGTWANDGDGTLDLQPAQGTTKLASNLTIDHIQIGPDTIDLDAYTLEISYIYSAGAARPFKGGTGTVFFNSPLALNIIDLDYFNLTVNSSTGVTNIFGTAAVIVKNDLTLTGPGTMRCDFDLDIDGSVTINLSGGAFDFANRTIRVAKDWNYNSGSTTFSGCTIIMDGTVAQSFNGAASPAFTNLIINNTSATGVTLNTPLTIYGTLALTDGILYTTGTYIKLMTAATTTVGNSGSFVDGPMKKVGNTNFTLPLGDGNVWAPIGISVTTGNTTDEYTIEYHFADYGDPTVSTVNNASTIEYWDINQTGDPNVSITLHWKDAARSDINDFATTDLVVSGFSVGNWIDMGQLSIVSADPGEVTSNSFVLNLPNIPVTFGSKSATVNPLNSGYYWVGNAGNWPDAATHWATASGGTTFRPAAPTSGNDVYFDSNSFTGPGQIITLPAGTWNCKSINFLDITKTPVMTGSGMLIVGQ